MKQTKTKLGIINKISLILVFLLLTITGSNAQDPACKKTLDELNAKQSGIPENRIEDYEICLQKTEDYYTREKSRANNSNAEQKRIKSTIASLRNDSTINTKLLGSYKEKQKIDSVNDIQKKINGDIAKQYEELNKISNGNEVLGAYKTTLKESYSKISEYYNSINMTTKKNAYQTKLKNLNGS